MSLAATLAASGMRPASSLPSIKCSSCGDEIEISSMGEHECSSTPTSPKAAPASLHNAFTLRQLNALDKKPALPSPLQFSGSETRPAQPSPLQFNGSETRPAQPSPLQFNSASPQMRPRAPTVGSATLSLPKGSRPALPRINPDAANQPFLGPIPPTPQSPASSIRSASSGSSRAPPKRSMTSPMPRLWDRPPSPELSANLDCAFPPFPTPSIAKRKASNASQSSSRSGPRPDLYTLDSRSPVSGPGESGMNGFNVMRNGSLERSVRRPSNEDRSPRDLNASARPSPQSTPLSPLEEFPSPQPLRPVEITPPVAPLETFDLPARSSSSQDMQRNPSQKRVPPQRPPRPDEPMPAILNPGPSFVARQPSQKRLPPERPARPEEGIPASLLNPLTITTFNARAPLSPTLPPPVPALPPPVPIRNADRSRTMPVPLHPSDEITAPPLSKMPSEPAMRYQHDSTSTAQPAKLPRQEDADHESRLDPRMQDAPPVPRSVQLHRTESLHKSSESGLSTASSILSLGDLSMGNSNTTAGTSPVGSASGSLDAFLTTSIEQELEEDALHAAGLSLKTPQRPSSPVEQAKDNMLQSAPRVAELVPSEGSHGDGDELSPPSLPASPEIGSWPMESPMDPALHNGILGEQVQSNPKEQSPIKPKQELLLAPESPKLERLSSAVYDPKRPFSSQPPAEEQPVQNRLRSRSSADSFKGFNFGSAFATTPVEQTDSSAYSSRKPSFAASPIDQSDSSAYSSRKPSLAVTPIDQIDSAPSSRKPSESAPSTTSDSSNTPTQTPPPPPPPSEIPSAPPVPINTPRPALMRRGTMGVKAACRGCHKQIEGKSVKAADGRLTGRWHKACFVCHTCKAPFETVDFYVINNQPYCEQHYHEKNGSLCYGCQRGIEGQFLETRSGPSGRVVRKYHRKCFTCVDCRMVLADDYFEIAGRIHCERHALAAMRSQTRRPSAPGVGTSVPRESSGLKTESMMNEKPRTRILQT